MRESAPCDTKALIVREGSEQRLLVNQAMVLAHQVSDDPRQGISISVEGVQ